MQQPTSLHVVQCAASVVDPSARVNKSLHWQFLGPGDMRESPHVLGHEGASTGLDGSEVCRLVIFSHGDWGCFPPRALFFLGAWWSLLICQALVGLIVGLGTTHPRLQRKQPRPYQVVCIFWRYGFLGRWLVLWRVASSSSVASLRRYPRLQRKVSGPYRVTCVCILLWPVARCVTGSFFFFGRCAAWQGRMMGGKYRQVTEVDCKLEM